MLPRTRKNEILLANAAQLGPVVSKISSKPKKMHAITTKSAPYFSGILQSQLSTRKAEINIFYTL